MQQYEQRDHYKVDTFLIKMSTLAACATTCTQTASSDNLFDPAGYVYCVQCRKVYMPKHVERYRRMYLCEFYCSFVQMSVRKFGCGGVGERLG
jgi:hypothetical protein